MAKCTFHAFSVITMGQTDHQLSADAIWATLTNAANYQGGIATVTDTHLGTGYLVELREFSFANDIAIGCLAKCRQDSPPIRRPDRTEILRPLTTGHTLLEKNFFLYSKQDRILIWQFNLSGNSYSAFASMLGVLSGRQQAFICEPKVERLNMDFDQVEIEYVDFAVSMPTSARERNRLLTQNPTDWGNLNPFKTMEQMGARQFAAKFTAKRKTTLSEGLMKFVTTLSTQPTIKRLKVKIEDCDEPIDVLASRFKSTKDVTYHQGQHLDSTSMFAALSDVWADYQQAADGP